MMKFVEKKSSVCVELFKGERLKIVDVEGGQISSFQCVFKNDLKDYLSSGRTLDYLGRMNFEVGDFLYSNKSKPMLILVEDTIGIHDFLLAPCSRESFKILYEDYECLYGCEENLIASLAEFGVKFDSLPTTFNIFMNLEISVKGSLEVLTPASRAGDYVTLEAKDDLIIGFSSCSAPDSHGGKFKRIGYEILS